MKFKDWFKFGWFTSKDRETLNKSKESIERVEKKVEDLVAAAAKKEEAPIAPAQPLPKGDESPYKNLIYSNGNLTVVFRDGVVLDKMAVDREFFEKIKNAEDKETIVNLMVDTLPPPPPPSDGVHICETPEERAIVNDNLEILRDHPDFVVEGSDVNFKGVSLKIPAPVLASFIEILEKLEIVEEKMRVGKESYDLLAIDQEKLIEQYHALKMFWLKLALNPLPQSREDLLVFCKNNDVRISLNGNLILYRRIVSLAGADKKYIAFVTQTYYSMKKKGEDPRNFAIGQKKGGAYYFVDLRENQFTAEELIGNLQHMYVELPDFENNLFTAAHDRSMKIKIGGIYSIPNEKINLDNGLCAAGGLHAAAVNYNYSGFGDTPVVVLVNPSKAITVPRNETGKLRTTEMFIACVNDKDLGIHFDDEGLTSFDEEYHDLTLAQLEVAARGNNMQELGVKEHMPAISLVDLKTIQKMLRTRIKEII